MSQSLTQDRPGRERSSIDMDDFDRRLRQHEASAFRNDDPLAELARLVGEHKDPFVDVFAQEAPAHHPQTSGQALAASGTGQTPRFSGDFAAIEAGLRGALPEHHESAAALAAAEHEFYAQHEHYPSDAYAHDEQAYAHQDQTQWTAPPQPHVAPVAAARRGRRPIYAVAATIAVGIIGVGGAFAFKGASSSPSAIKTIAAASGPTKIQPPAEASNDQGAQDSAMLGKKGVDAPNKLVSREEQPVDVSQAVQENASRNADTGTGAPGDAANVPVPPSPSQANGGSEQMGFGVGMPAPKKVKVVSVRPDGSILQNDAPPSAAMGIPSMAAQQQPAVNDPIAQAASPQASTPGSSASKPSTSKSAKSSKKTTRVATAKPKSMNDDGDDAPAAKPARTQVASAEAEDTTASLGSHSGGFAVQLAAPGSEADARSMSSKLSKKFSSALSGRHLGFRKAQSNGKSVYRVRVGSLTKADAVSLCEKLKADGGSCFVAKNN